MLNVEAPKTEFVRAKSHLKMFSWHKQEVNTLTDYAVCGFYRQQYLQKKMFNY